MNAAYLGVVLHLQIQAQVTAAKPGIRKGNIGREMTAPLGGLEFHFFGKNEGPAAPVPPAAVRVPARAY
jgi:hypothetical protein